MKTKTRKAATIAAAAVVALLVATIGYSMGTRQQAANETASISDGVMGVTAPQASTVQDQSMYGATPSEEAAKLAVTTRETASSPVAGQSADSLVIVNGSMEIRVKDVESSLESLRASVTRAGAEITDLSVTAGGSGVTPGPLESPAGDPTARGPASAIVTIRVPAGKLDSLRNELGKLGSVLSQSANASDVTEQAIDLEARLRNLRAEEIRLRAFLAKTNKVSDLLAVERELARVRGEIESMDAQLTYLKRQAARATLTVSLSEPGPVIQPAGNSWGLRDAITRGIQATIAMLSTMITVAIPLAFLALAGAVVFVPVRAALRRRAAKRSSPNALQSNPGDES